MFRKNGNTQQRRATQFDNTPATGMSLCPFKDADIAIVPLRYALDRSHYDVDCPTLKPLPASGAWAYMPTLRTRAYTLRQLYAGYLYVFDETANTFHEYAVSSTDATLARIVWTDAHLGTDQRSGGTDPKPYLLYPRTNRLHLGFSPRQWTWRLCEHMRSNADSRARWMKAVDLARYCGTMAEPGTLPLSRIAEAVADIDLENVTHNGRFNDSSVPTTNGNDQTPAQPQSQCSPAGADVYWLGSVPDKDSALLIALDDPLAVLTDLGLQLAADQAALRAWQEEHEHKARIAKAVTNLCASSDNPDQLPLAVKNDVVLTQRYLGEVDACLERQLMEESEYLASSLRGDAMMTPGTMQSREMKQALQARYGKAPSQEDYASWEQRAKWRREIDLEGARAYIAKHQPAGDVLARTVRDTQSDLIQWAEHIGVEPSIVFIDTTNPGSLLYLQSIMSDLLVILAQDVHTHSWLLEQEDSATTLFGTMRYGFSAGLKDALHQDADRVFNGLNDALYPDADRLLNGLGDYTNLATRMGELNSVLNHPRVTNSSWMLLLKQSVRETLSALGEVVVGEGKSIAETILTTWIPVDSRRVSGAHSSLVALVRTLMIGRILIDSPQQLAIETEVSDRLKNWKREQRVLNKRFHDLQRSWQYPSIGGHDRRNVSRQLQKLRDAMRLHFLQIPVLLDFQNRQYAQLMHHEARQFLESGLRFEEWQAKAKQWMGRQASHLAAGVTWGVIMINFISTAFLFSDLTRDGDFNTRDIAKIGYGLAYSGNLLMAVYVAAPWALIQAAQPVVAEGRPARILERSASYWAKQGNTVWAETVRAFKAGMVLMGAFGVAGSVLELVDLYLDQKAASTQIEKNLIKIKMAMVALMGVGGIIGLAAGLFPAGTLPAAALGLPMAASLLMVGVVYLLITILLNQLKQDSVGLWLRKCCWSFSSENRYPATPDGITAEQRDFLEITLSPTVLVKKTFHTNFVAAGDFGTRPVAVRKQNGAWVQILFPNHLRGRSIELNIISSERPWNELSVEQSHEPVADDFLNNGRFDSASLFGTVNNERPVNALDTMYFPPVPPVQEDVVWHTWVPLNRSARYIELQVWYPQDLIAKNPESDGYAYQIELSKEANTAGDGLLFSTLAIKKLTRSAALTLEIPA